MKKTSVIALLALLSLLASCGNQTTRPSSEAEPNTSDAGKTNISSRLKIGFAMDTLKEERWVRDKEAFEAHCKKLDVDCIVTVADNKADKQANDVENMLTQGVNAIVIAPHDATQAASMVEKAKAQGVPVISYDRLINSDKVDLYISHQVPVIGRKIAEYALAKVPMGNYVMVYGASTDNNAVIMRKEMEAVLMDAKAKGDIKIVADQYITDWKPVEALNFAENALTQNADKVDAFVVSNDGMAGGVISALEKKGLAGKVIVTGQDAQADALQRIAEGKQSMTVYKPIIPLANAALEAAVKLAKREPLSDAKPFMNESLKKEVPSILLEVIVVDIDNLMATVIKDGFAKFEDVYKNVPADRRPKQ